MEKITEKMPMIIVRHNYRQDENDYGALYRIESQDLRLISQLVSGEMFWW